MPFTFAAVLVILAWLPGAVARGRRHSEAGLINTCGWLGLLYPFASIPALVWALTQSPRRAVRAQTTDGKKTNSRLRVIVRFLGGIDTESANGLDLSPGEFYETQRRRGIRRAVVVSIVGIAATGILNSGYGFAPPGILQPRGWFVVGAVLAAGEWGFTRRALRPDRLRAEGRCLNCGYDLTGNVSGRCPECGQVVEDPPIP